jgi:hypothetical protein
MSNPSSQTIGVAMTATAATRISLTISNANNTVPVTCADISCQPIPGMYVGLTIQPGKQQSFLITTNDRVFCKFVDSNENVYALGMTCPKSSNNSAEGCVGKEGLQAYKDSGTPVDFTYKFGGPNLADWDNPSTSTPNNSIVAYGDC